MKSGFQVKPFVKQCIKHISTEFTSQDCSDALTWCQSALWISKMWHVTNMVLKIYILIYGMLWYSVPWRKHGLTVHKMFPHISFYLILPTVFEGHTIGADDEKKVRGFGWIAQGCQPADGPSTPTGPGHRAGWGWGISCLPALWSFWSFPLLPEMEFPGRKTSQGELVGLCGYSKIAVNCTYADWRKHSINKLLAFLFRVALQKIFAETITLGNQKLERELLQEQ